MRWSLFIKLGPVLVVALLVVSSLSGTSHHVDPEEARAMIAGKAETLRIAPVDARIDRVWKAIPGYNGLEVDIDATLQLYLDHPDPSKIPFVYREIEPNVQLADLAPSPIYKGNPNKPMVAFMVNVAWGNEYLPSIRKTLRDEQVKTTFFLDGSWLRNNRAIAEELLKEGHELSNHAYSHKMMSQLSWSQAAEEIRKTEALLQELGVQNRLFAPPSGDFDDETVQIAGTFKLYTVLWTIDTVDWKKPSARWVYERITSRMEPGAMILMHPTKASSESLQAMIQYAKKQGYHVGTVSELLSEQRLKPVEHSPEK